MRPRIAKRGLVFGVLVVIIATLVGLWIFRPVLYRIEPLAEYDYVIVGAGTSGCVLAERLSAQPSNNVLLIEAGGEAPWYSWIPFASPFIQGTRHDWQYFTVAQKHAAAALQNRESSWPQGKMLGGTGQMNFMIHTSGSAEDFDSWKISGWEAKSMVAILDRLSCWIPQDGPEVQDEFIASSMSWFGEVSTDAVCDHQSPCDHAKTVSRQQQCPITAIKVEKIDVETSPLAAAFLDAGRLLGRPVRDLNQWWRQPGPFGFMASQNTIHEGYRWSTFRSHLQPVLQRPNLHVLPHSTVSKVLLDGRRAIGVQLTDARGRSRTVAAQREVLLSAGAIKSPQILQLSGIGSPHVLEPLDIPLLADLPVGKNLQDHLQVPLFVELVNSSVSVNIAKMLRPTQLWNYLMHRTGMLASSGIEGIATFPLRSNTSSTSHGMLILFNLGSIDANAYSRVANIHLSAFHKWFPKADNFHQEGFVLLSVCLHPKSRGQVRIRTTDVSDHPEIDPDYLSHPDDVRCLADTIRQGAQLIETEPFKKLGARLMLPEFPDCLTPHEPKPKLANDRYLECLIRTAALTMYHPSSTCTMGRADDPQAVVDPLLRFVTIQIPEDDFPGNRFTLECSARVRGIKGLRVVDASVLPRLPSGPPNSVLIAVADRAADFVLADGA